MADLKMLFPLRRREGVTHEQVVACWRDIHMARVIQHLTPNQYSVTIFDQAHNPPFDGMASVTYDDPARGRYEQGRNMPGAVAQDGFGDLVGPTERLEGTEHVIVDGTRPPDAHKITAFVTLNDGGDQPSAWRCWLDVHAPNVAKEFQAKGGLRYAITLTDQNRASHPFLGIAELLYLDRASAKRHLSEVAADPFMALTTAKLLHGIELIGIA